MTIKQSDNFTIMKKILILSITCLFAVNIFAQEELIRCGNSIHQEALQATYPDFTENVNAKFDEAITAIAQPEYKSNNVVYNVPVVIHVVYKNSSENLTDAQIQSQMDVLNADYRSINPDGNQVPNLFGNLVSDAEIEFCLATVDPNGNPTSGVTRTQTNVGSFSISQDNIKSTAAGGRSPWDTDRYLNIWVGEITGGVLGYATPPGTPAARDGVVIGYTYFGTNGTATFPYNKGRTCTHEIGHYLGLRHIWGDGNCGVDDGISDTPLQESQYGGCPNFGSPSTTSCGSQDMFMNFMDYTDDRCMFMFTHKQVDLMRYVLEKYRPGLVQNASVACDPTGGAGCRDLTEGLITMGFEDGENFGGWTVLNNNDDDKQWNISEGVDPEWGPRTGSKCMAYTWSASAAADDWFFTPCFDVESARDYELRFWYATGNDAGFTYPEKFKIVVSSSASLDDILANADFEEIVQPYNPNQPDNNYESYSIQLPDYGDTQIHVGFHCYSDADQYAMLIDDIEIIDITAVSNENAIVPEAFQTYPNPASDQLTMDFNFDKTIEDLQINLVDLTGKIIHTEIRENYAAGNLQLDVSAYPSGVYFLNVQADEQMTTRKVVVSK